MSVGEFLDLLPMRDNSSVPFMHEGQLKFDAAVREIVRKDRDEWQSFRLPRIHEAPLHLEGHAPMRFMNAYAVGVPTPFDVTFEVDVNDAHELWQKDVVGKTVFSNTDGDGSVPISSGMDDGIVFLSFFFARQKLFFIKFIFLQVWMLQLECQLYAHNLLFLVFFSFVQKLMLIELLVYTFRNSLESI